MSGGAQPGNQFGVALKDPQIRQKAFKSFCDHLSTGKSVKSWYYEDELDNLCCWETMVSYINKFPHEFQSIKKKVAETKGFKHWEKVVEDVASGKNREGNVAALQMLMRNKYGWDKIEQSHQQNHTIKFEKNGGLATGLSAEAISNITNQCSE